MSKALQVLQLMGATPCDPNDGKVRNAPSPGALFYEWNGLLLTMDESYFRIESYIDEYHSDEEPAFAEVFVQANRIWQGMKDYHDRVDEEVQKFKKYFEHSPFVTTVEIDETEHMVRFYRIEPNPAATGTMFSATDEEHFVAGFRIHYRDVGPLRSPRKKFMIAAMGGLSVFPHMEALRYEEAMVKTTEQFESMLATWFKRDLSDENGTYAAMDEDAMRLVVPVKYAARYFGYMRQAIDVTPSTIKLKTTCESGDEDGLVNALFPYMNDCVEHKVFVVEL